MFFFDLWFGCKHVKEFTFVKKKYPTPFIKRNTKKPEYVSRLLFCHHVRNIHENIF